MRCVFFFSPLSPTKNTPPPFPLVSHTLGFDFRRALCFVSYPHFEIVGSHCVCLSCVVFQPIVILRLENSNSFSLECCPSFSSGQGSPATSWLPSWVLVVGSPASVDQLPLASTPCMISHETGRMNEQHSLTACARNS